MSSLMDLRRALARFNGLPEGELVSSSEALKYLADTDTSLNDEEIGFRIRQIDGLTPEMEALRAKEKGAGQSRPSERLNDYYAGLEGPHASTTSGVKISAPRRTSMRGNPAVRTVENAIIGKE